MVQVSLQHKKNGEEEGGEARRGREGERGRVRDKRQRHHHHSALRRERERGGASQNKRRLDWWLGIFSKFGYQKKYSSENE
jgi:hypothetical protein